MKKILLVDDDPDVIDACRMVLEKQGYEVSDASNRRDALDAINANCPDLLILDVMMENPDDGISMAQQLRREGFDKPILMLSGIGQVTEMKYDKDEDRLPVDVFVNKPVKPAVLVEKVKDLLT